ncbi:DUF1772 domain-containing protein [soil metagenome]
MIVLEFLSLLFAGLAAGVEFIVRYGVQPALSRLDARANIAARQSLIGPLRVVVPSLMLPTVGLAVATAILAGGGGGVMVLRWTGTAAVVAYLLFSFLGTVPINIAVNDWVLDDLPADWHAVIQRWEVIDVFRSSAAIVGFGLLLLAALL